MAIFYPAQNTTFSIFKGAAVRRTYVIPVGGILTLGALDTIWFTASLEADGVTALFPAFSTADSEPNAAVTIDTVNNAFTIFIPHIVTGDASLNGIDEGFYDVKFIPAATPQDVSILARGPIIFTPEPLRQGQPT